MEVRRYLRAELVTFDRDWRAMIRGTTLEEVARGAQAEEAWLRLVLGSLCRS